VDLKTLREQTETLTTSLEQRRAEVASGKASCVGRSELFRSFREVVSWEAVHLVREAAAKAEGRRGSRLRTLEAHLIDLLFEAEAGESLDQTERGVRALVTGLEPGLDWSLDFALTGGTRDPDRDSRARTEARARATAMDLDPVWARLWDRRQTIAQKAGFASALSAWCGALDLELAAVEADAAEFLSATEAMYLDVSSWWLRRCTAQRPFPHGAERHDLLHALWMAPFDGLFPGRGTGLALVEKLVAAGAVPRVAVHVDGELRAGKDPIPQVFPIEPPGSVAISFRAESGAASVRDALQAFGEAQHFASIDAERPLEDRVLGDRALPAAFGVLLRNIPLDRKWLRRSLPEVPADLPRVLALQSLFELRQTCAILLQERQQDREGLRAGHGERYGERLSAALGARWPSELVLWDCRPFPRTLLRYAAAAFESVLFPVIRERFDEDWWMNPRTGVFLQKISRQGQLESCRQVARAISTEAPRLIAAVPRFAELLG
jgi:hypothetical protein